MAIGLKVGDRVFSGEEILPLLQQYGILQQLAQNLLIDQVLDEWSTSPSGLEHWTDEEEEKDELDESLFEDEDPEDVDFDSFDDEDHL